ncbi:MAG: integrase arm-type DNA-binding domain-containing protein [Sulfuriferula sp.]|nr:integrase arm-type DNA-binding domain-containing protein [Sulfuriferula sp.]
MPLTDTTLRNAKPKDAPYSLADERGLSIQIRPTGGKWWRFRYRFDGAPKMLSLGVYPDVSLKAARKLRDEARELLAQGIDPSINRKVQKATKQERAANSFEVIAREWCAKNAPTWAKVTSDKTIRMLERDIFPWIGGRPITDILPMELLTTVQRIEKRGAVETAHRALATCGQVFRHAIATDRAIHDPVPSLRDALTTVKGGHFPAVTEPKQVAELLRTLDGYTGTFTVKCALAIAPMVFVRPAELRTAKWADIDLDNAEWRYHVTKTKTDHIVPLATQAVAILRELHALTGQGAYVFPSARGNARPMSDNAILGAMRRLGIPKDEMTGHGFRAMARTVLDEVLKVRVELIEHQLAHAVRDPLGRAYNRTKHLPERREMMQQWADYLDKLKAGADVIQIKSA